MSAACCRRVASTAFAAVALLLASGGVAQAAPPVCPDPAPQTVLAGYPHGVYALESCSDPEGLPLTFAVSTEPMHGTATVNGGFVFYIADADYSGPDSFTFTASDGTEMTAVTVSITVEPNQPPTCPATMTFEAEPDRPSPFYPLECTDAVGFVVGFRIDEDPAHGTLEPDLFAGLVYTPDTGYRGPDSFAIVAIDELGAESDPMVVNVTVLAPNRLPRCVTPVTVRVPAGGRVPLDYRTTCSDPDGDAMSVELVVGPRHGRFEFAASGLIDFVAQPGYTGTDRFTYRVRDRRGGTSNVAAVDLVIGNLPAPAKPPAPAVTAPDVTAPAFELTRAGAQKLGAVRRRGLKLRLVSDEAGVAKIELAVTKQIARRYGINRKAKGRVVIGRLTKTLVPGDNEVVVKLAKRARKRLATANRVTLLVVVSGRDAAGNAARETLKVKLRR